MKAMKVLAIVALLAGASLEAEDWPCFRGPTRQGISSEKGLPIRWSAESNVKWKTEIPGEGWSSPIVSGERVLVTTAAEGGESCRILSLDRRTGRLLWDREVFRQPLMQKQARNSHATPTPATDGRVVFAAFGAGGLAAVDIDGKVRWTNLEFPFHGHHGLGASILLHEDLVIMPRDGSSEGPDKKVGWQVPWDRSFVLALDKSTGKLRWKAMRGLSRIGHVTPNIWKAPDGAVQVVSGAGDVVQGFDAASGKLLWSSLNAGEGVVPSIVIGDGLAFAASGWGGRESLKAFRLGKSGELGEENLAWEQKKGMPRIPSALYLEPHLYTITDGGVANCLDAATGEIVWQKRIGGNHSASPVAAEGRIYFTADDGKTTVIEAGPESEVLAENPLGERTEASMAVSGGCLFIRTAKRLFCIGE